MRIEDIKKLIKQYDWKLIEKAPDVRISLLNDYIAALESTSNNSENNDITFANFEDYLRGKGEDPNVLFNVSYLKSEDESATVFRSFLRSDSVLTNLPDEVILNIMKMTRPRDFASLLCVSSFFYEKGNDRNFLQSRLSELGFDKELLKEVARAIDNYQPFKKIHDLSKDNLIKWNEMKYPWEFLWCSGATEAAKKVAQHISGLGAEGRNPLHYAALSGNIELMKYAIEELRILPDSVDHNGMNALHYAAIGGNTTAMRYAVDVLKIDCHSIGGIRKFNALHYAAMSGKVDAMAYAVNNLGIDPNSTNSYWLNALHLAANFGHAQAMEYAAKILKIPTGQKSKGERNALHYAAMSGDIRSIKLAVEWGIDPNSISQEGKTALLYVTGVDAAKYLIYELNADPYSTDFNGSTALHYAVTSEDAELIMFLRKLGLNPYQKNDDGDDAFDYAEKNENLIQALSIPIMVEENKDLSKKRPADEDINSQMKKHK